MTFDLTYQRATECTGEQPGTRVLLDYCEARWPHVWSKGIYVCRNIRGSATSKSVHSEGRAVDIGVNEDTNEGLRIGDDIAAWLTGHAPTIGVQYLIWNGRSWRPDRGWRPYRGTSNHRDHLHVELTREAAALLTVDALSSTTEAVHGTDTREGEQVGPWDIPGVISYAVDTVNAAVFLLTDSGAVFAFPPGRYRGAPNNETQGREFDIIGEPDSILIGDHGYSYVVSTDLDFTYGY